MGRKSASLLSTPASPAPPGTTAPNFFHFALTPDGANSFWWPDLIASPGSSVPQSQVLLFAAGVVGVAQAQGIIANVTDPTVFTLIIRMAGGDTTAIGLTVSYGSIPIGASGVAGFSEVLVEAALPAGDTLIAVTFPVTPGIITAGELLQIQVSRSDGNIDDLILVAGYLA